jgi:hypothetical protein
MSAHAINIIEWRNIGLMQQTPREVLVA